MKEGIIIAVISLVGVISAGLFTLLNSRLTAKLRRQEKEADKLRPTLQQVAKAGYEFDKQLFDIREELLADTVLIARFHNGGKFIDGVPIDKFSVTNEESIECSTSYLQEVWSNTMLSQYAHTMHELIFRGICFNPSLSDIADKKYLQVCHRHKFQSSYLILIKDLNEDPIGFIGVFFKKKRVLDDGQLRIIYKKHNKFLNLLKLVNNSTPEE